MNQNAVEQSNQSIANQSTAMLANIKSAAPVIVEARVFRSNLPSCRYTFKAGKTVSFIGGRYTTNLQNEITELDAEIASGHPNFTSKPEEVVNTIEPLEALKAKFFKEFTAQQAAAVRKDNDVGTSTQTKLNVVNSSTIANAAAGSDTALEGAAPEVASEHVLNSTPAQSLPGKISVSLPKK